MSSQPAAGPGQADQAPIQLGSISRYVDASVSDGSAFLAHGHSSDESPNGLCLRVDTLVILGSSLTALAVLRDAHEHGLRTIVVDFEYGPALTSRWPIRLFLGCADPSTTLEKLRGIAGPTAALVSTSDRWLRFIAANRAELDAVYAAVLHPDNATLEVCLDKLRFARWCTSHRVPTPLTWLGGVEQTPAKARFPVLVRPAQTRHSDPEKSLPKAVEANDPDELEAWIERYREVGVTPLVSESLLGRDLEQCSVGFARSGSRTVAFTARKIRPTPERCAVGTCVEMCIDPAAEELGRIAAERLNYYGIGEVEILRDRSTGEQFVIEVNARPWLQYALAPASGHDFLELLLGRPSKKGVRQVREGKVWINVKEDLFNAFSRSVGLVRHGRVSLPSFVASVIRSNVFAVFDLRDPTPFLKALTGRAK